MPLARASRFHAGILGAAAAFALAAAAGAAGMHQANFPSKGVVVPGVSIGGIQIGMSQEDVLARWGRGFEVCHTCGANLTWLYEYQGSDPLGAAIRFGAGGKVVAVYTLGSPRGWGARGKVMMLESVSRVYNLGNPRLVPCVGYSALVIPAGRNSMSIYTYSGLVYGFALTAPGEPPCQ